MNAQEHYKAGNLKDALAAALDDVKRHPSDADKRGFLVELLCLTGDFDRADRQLDTLGQQDPDSVVTVGLFRQLVQAEKARQQFHSGGGQPEFLGQDVPPAIKLHLQAAALVRSGKEAEATELLAQAEEQRPKVSGTCNGQAFDDLRDLDDLTSSFFEVFTTTGKYYWIPFERVEGLEFKPLESSRDLLWRRAHMVVRSGPDVEVFLPALYAGTHADPDDQIRLGRSTQWRGDPGAPIRGVGQRIFLVGNEDRPILELKSLTINA